MRITKVKLDNYVCFYDSPEFELGPGINFVVGKNNSGKTALLDALSCTPDRKAHQSLCVIPERPGMHNESDVTDYELEYQFDDGEVQATLTQPGIAQIYIPIFSENWNADDRNRQLELDLASDHTSLALRFRYRDNRANSLFLRDDTVWKASTTETLRCFVIPVADFGKNCQSRGQHTVEVSNTFIGVLERYARSRIYRFQAERHTYEESSPNQNFELRSNAANLAQVLHSLKDDDPSAFERYFSLLQRIFPDIREIKTPVMDGKVKLRISDYDATLRRPDLAIDLADRGTGLGQVMAMLFVILFYEDTRVIIIDEPYSFLHPSAIRELLAIFREFCQHQYILSTHSPTAIMSVPERTIILVQRAETVSSANKLDSLNNRDLEAALNEVGTKRSDIFGMDAVIWVEGKTDKICFNLVMDKHGGLPAGVEIIDLVHTGDFSDKKRGALIEQIYARLSGSVGILPSALAFVFDGDLQNDDFEETHTRKFLPRQNYESYLIYSEILADILNRDAADDKSKDHTADSVRQWIRDNEGKEFDDAEWLKSVDGAKLLSAMFQDLAGISYKGNKAQYGEEITKRILEECPNHFQEIVDLIKSILPDAT